MIYYTKIFNIYIYTTYNLYKYTYITFDIILTYIKNKINLLLMKWMIYSKAQIRNKRRFAKKISTLLF